MPLVRLIAEGVGPFERLDLDFSDGNGKPHLGPHILAGVNGSGKSTLLRTIAWLLDRGKFGFQYDDWGHFLEGHSHSRAVAVFQLKEVGALIYACAGGGRDSVSDVIAWAAAAIRPLNIPLVNGTQILKYKPFRTIWRASYPREGNQVFEFFNVAAYAPSKALKHLSHPDLTRTISWPFLHCLAFDEAVQNESIQAWLLSLYSKRAIARERHQSDREYAESLARFEAALRLIYGEDVSFEVEIEPRFQPRLKVRGKSLNFSQLPDGVRSSVAWIADFMMRQDQ